ncbi:MAG TPA: L-2-hydroxyglutarate oxidase [Actinomycetota bacterium]|nr:L-2-hydroxyglutarate oxidase [Actinomycetota bacterium]
MEDVAVVGAGLVGLATGYALVRAHPGLRVVVLEKEGDVARHQSSRNSGVVHSGIYYRPGSLRARLCVEGRRALERFAQDRGVPYRRTGKLVVAVRPEELPRLRRLAERAAANGVEGVREVGPEEIQELEPHVRGLRALHVPVTGVVDFGAMARALADELGARGGRVLLRCGVRGLERRSRSVVLTTEGGEVEARGVVSCAGLQADRLARLTGDAPEVRVVPFRGSFWVLRPEAARLVRGLVYPVPDPALPFLGVHFTRRVDGQVWVGPNAVLALAREGYRRGEVDLRDLLEVLRFPGFWRLALRYGRTGLGELLRERFPRAFLRECRRYVPDLGPEDLRPGPSGVRAQLVAADGSLVDDFVVARRGRILHVLNAPSPAATACLAIGETLSRWALEDFGLA